MRELVLMLTALGVATLAEPSIAQPPAQQESTAVSSYSAPVEKHVKKLKKKRAAKPAASAAGQAPAASPAAGQ